MSLLAKTILVFAVVLTGLLSTAAPADATAAAVGPRAAAIPAVRLRSTFSFVVERDGTSLGAFSEVSGISSENEIVEFREGGEDVVRKIPGRLKYSNITLKRGITTNMDLWNWRQEVVDGTFPKSNVIVTLLGPDGTQVAKWNFENAWPSKVVGPQTKADDNGIAIESLEIVHEGLVRLE